MLLRKSIMRGRRKRDWRTITLHVISYIVTPLSCRLIEGLRDRRLGGRHKGLKDRVLE